MLRSTGSLVAGRHSRRQTCSLRPYQNHPGVARQLSTFGSANATSAAMKSPPLHSVGTLALRCRHYPLWRAEQLGPARGSRRGLFESLARHVVCALPGRVPQPPCRDRQRRVTPKGARHRGGLLLVPFLGRARKGTSRRATPGRSCFILCRCSSAQPEPFIVLRGDIRADLPVVRHPAGVRHENARLAGNVGAEIPRVLRLRQQRRFGGRVHLRHPESTASSFGSMRFRPCLRICAMQSVIHSTCCSIATGMLQSTDGLPGPVTMNRFGKPATCRPR